MRASSASEVHFLFSLEELPQELWGNVFSFLQVRDFSRTWKASVAWCLLFAQSLRSHEGSVRPGVKALLQAFPGLRVLDLEASVSSRLSWELVGDLSQLDTHHWLEHLSLANNKLDPHAMRRIIQSLQSPKLAIQSLDLSGNELDQEGVDCLAWWMSQDEHLRHIKLGPSLAENVESLGRAIQANRGLRSLNVNGSKLGLRLLPILQALEDHPSLRVLEIRRCRLHRLERRAGLAPREILQYMRSLRVVNLSANSLSKEFLVEIFHLMASGVLSFREVSLAENEIEEDAAGEPYFQIGSLLTRCRSLRRLELRRMNIGETALTSLVDGLIQQAEGDESWHLEYLSLAENSIRTGVSQPLVDMLRRNPGLRELDISKNFLSRGGSVERFLPASKLRTLRMDDVVLSDKGGFNLAAGILGNHTLRHLHIEGSALTDTCGDVLLSAFQQNSSLRHVHMRNSKIGPSMQQQLKELQHQRGGCLQIDCESNRKKMLQLVHQLRREVMEAVAKEEMHGDEDSNVSCSSSSSCGEDTAGCAETLDVEVCFGHSHPTPRTWKLTFGVCNPQQWGLVRAVTFSSVEEDFGTVRQASGPYFLVRPNRGFQVIHCHIRAEFWPPGAHHPVIREFKHNLDPECDRDIAFEEVRLPLYSHVD